jgi:hypothetical protein
LSTIGRRSTFVGLRRPGGQDRRVFACRRAHWR